MKYVVIPLFFRLGFVLLFLGASAGTGFHRRHINLPGLPLWCPDLT